MALAGLLAAVLLAQAVDTKNQPAQQAAQAAAQAAAAAEKAAVAAEKAVQSIDAKVIERLAVAAEKAALAAEKAVLVAEKVAVAPVAAPPAAAPVPSKSAGWSGNAGLGFVSLSGNANTLTTSGNLELRRTVGDWLWGAKATGVYGTARNDTGGDKTIAMAADLSARGDRKFNDFVSAFVGAGVGTDHIRSVELSYFGEVGAGIFWIDEKTADKKPKHFLRTDLAARFQREQRFQYYDANSVNVPLDLADVSIFGPRLGLAYIYMLRDGVGFLFDADALPNVLNTAGNTGRFLVSAHPRIQAALTSTVGINIGFKYMYDSKPAAGRKTTDTMLTSGITASF